MNHNGTLLSLAVVSILALAPALGASALVAPAEPTGVVERIVDSEGRLLRELGIEPTNPLVAFVKHYHHRPGHGGSGGGGGGNDCASTAYKTTGYFWTTTYSGYSTDYASVLSTSGNTWDSSTGASIFGGISSGNRGTAGVYDGVNQHAWTNLGASSTIAVTTTWYYRGSGEAVESDAEYNTYYAWSTSGASGAMDVQNIATHELGHTFGLGHPNGSGIDCLTMYAYASEGETQKRTLGTGDILGIQALYGA